MKSNARFITTVLYCFKVSERCVEASRWKIWWRCGRRRHCHIERFQGVEEQCRSISPDDLRGEVVEDDGYRLRLLLLDVFKVSKSSIKALSLMISSGI